MRLNYQQLEQNLQKKLFPVYLISGDEPMQKLDGAETIRLFLKQQGVFDREIFHVDKKFDWSLLWQQSGAMSLFAEKNIIDIRLQQAPTKEGQLALIELMHGSVKDSIIIISAPKLTKPQQNQKWVKLIESHGGWLTVWPVDNANLTQWLITWSQQRQQPLSHDAAEYLAQSVQGNLLAAKQELDKAAIFIDKNCQINLDLLQQQVADNTRYSVWDLISSCLTGEVQLLPQMLSKLRQEKTSQILLARLLQKECQDIHQMSRLMTMGESRQKIFNQYRIWASKQRSYDLALKRFSAQGWQKLWKAAFKLEKIVVGLEVGDFWDDCLDQLLLMAGSPLWKIDNS